MSETPNPPALTPAMACFPAPGMGWVSASAPRSIRECRRHALLAALVLLAGAAAVSAAEIPDPLVTDTAPAADAFALVAAKTAAPIWVDRNDWPAVRRAAGDLQADVQRVTGVRPELSFAAIGRPPSAKPIIVGTVGKSALIDSLVASGKLTADDLRNKWESFVISTVAQPLPGVSQALVIAGSDRRGTIYGIYEISRQLGVSPWYWWADVPVKSRPSAYVVPGRFASGEPGVKYRGIFINDEDWGLHPWAAKTFDPEFGNIGPKTYAKVFELLLRLRLDYLWPAIHACSTAFGSVPENYRLADQYGIVVGASHCEPMLYNNVSWDAAKAGPWNYSTNRNTIHAIWEESAKARGAYEAVWTLGIRGVHDRAMETPPDDLPGKISLVTEIFHDQRALLGRYVSKQWGPIAQCFVPYKEVLPIYDAGLKVPDDVTLVWVDDNFGYIRRLSSPAERARSGGAGVYWHLSYYGGPHSYTWIDTTAPALLWEELHKAWENDARRLWVINVGDIKPGEIGIDYFSRLAWNPEGFPLGAQPTFLREFAAANFGADHAQPIADLLREFYQLGTVRKPELMIRAWAMSLTPARAAHLERAYRDLLQREKAVSALLAPAAGDAYTELVGFPVRVLGDTGLIFMADRKIQEGVEVAANEQEIARMRNELEAQVEHYNTGIAGGKWNRMMPGLVTGKNLMAWSSQVRWPWGEKPGEAANPSGSPAAQPAEGTWRDAATADRLIPAAAARWCVVPGLGPSGRAVALEPANSELAWKTDDAGAPALEYDFESPAGDVAAYIDFLPTFRIYPGMKLRVAVSVDQGAPVVVEVPGSSGAENENGPIRERAVQDNYVRARVPLPGLTAGKHTFTVRAIDPGAVIDRVSLP